MTTEYTDHFRLNLPDFRMGPWHDLLNSNAVTLDQLIFALYQGVDTQVWANNTSYQPGATAIDSSDNSFWVCIVEHISAPTGTFAEDRAAHPTYWNRVVVGIAPRGEWANSTHYLPNDMVSDSSEHVIAVCKTEHTSNISGTIRDDEVYWTFIADIGDVAAIAATVSYDNSTSGTSATNLQDTTDELYAKDAAQQPVIDANAAAVANHAPRIATLESSDSTQNAQIASGASSIAALDTRTTNLESSDSAQGTRITNLENADSTQDARLDSVEASNALKIPEAPVDGTLYGRKDGVWEPVASGGGGSGDVVGPAGAVSDNIAVFDGATGKLIKDGGQKVSDLALASSMPLPATVPPLVDGAAAVGTATKFAREDHVHPTDTSRQAALGYTPVDVAGNQTITGGYKVAPSNLGTLVSFTVNPALSNYQYGNNGGAFTLTAPASDCAVEIQVTNIAGAGAITFAGFTNSGASTGDALTTTSGHAFTIMIRCINGVSRYAVKAWQ